MQSGAVIYALDTSIAAMSLPKRAADFHSYSFQLFDPTTDDGHSAGAKGTAQLMVSNAPVMRGQLVGPPFWVPVPELTLDIGGHDAAPAFLRDLFNDVGWVGVSWTPGSGSSGTLAARFDGVRR